jgi:uncharacterized protein (DUF2267 family)
MDFLLLKIKMVACNKRRVGMNKAEFIYKIQEMTALPTLEMAQDATMIVLSLLSHRLTPEEARDVSEQLPRDLRQLWNSDTWITNFLTLSGQRQLKYRKKEELYSQIRNEIDKRQLQVGPEQLARAVFHTLKEQISEGEAQDIAAQLPEDIEQLWLAA